MREIILSAHYIFSIFYLVSSLLLIGISIHGLRKKSEFSGFKAKVLFATVLSLDFQLLFGLNLFFFSSSNQEIINPNTLKIFSRFWQTEHIILMLFAFATAHLGYIIIKKKSKSIEKYKSSLLYFSISTGMVILSLFAAHFS